jgi:hypothetical protein
VVVLALATLFVLEAAFVIEIELVLEYVSGSEVSVLSVLLALLERFVEGRATILTAGLLVESERV